MNKEVTYKVRQKFKYEGQTFSVGDEWQPSGARFDDTIINNGRYVVRVEQDVQPKPPARRKRKATK